MRRRSAIVAEAMAFQADLDRLVEEPAPLVLRLWPLMGAALIGALVLVAALVRVDVVVTATGRLATEAPPVILQPMTRATLREVLVEPGDMVVAGQVLARLDPTMTAADRDSLRINAAALRAKIARLEAELAGESLPLAAGLEAEVQADRAGLARAQRQQLEAVRAGLETALAAETAAGGALEDRRAIAREIETMRNRLAEAQSGSRLAAMEARLARIDAETAFEAHRARLQDLALRRAQAEAALRAFDIDQRRQTSEALADLTPRLAEVEEQLAKADRLANLSDLTAPRPAVVLSVAKGGAGSVMAEGEPVVVLVPTDAPLIAEIGIRSSEVGQIAAGDAVTLKIDAFPWRRHGMLEGRLMDVSHASFTPEGGTAALHGGRVSLTGQLHDMTEGAGLLPGMTLTAEIKTGTRSLIDYFLEPLMRGMSEALREP